MVVSRIESALLGGVIFLIPVRLFDIFEAVSCRVIISACTFSGFINYITPDKREKKRENYDDAFSFALIN